MSAKKPDTCKSLRAEIDAMKVQIVELQQHAGIDDDDEDDDGVDDEGNDGEPISPEDQDALEAVDDWRHVSPIERDRVIDMLRESDNPIEKAFGSRTCDELRHLLEAL